VIAVGLFHLQTCLLMDECIVQTYKNMLLYGTSMVKIQYDAEYTPVPIPAVNAYTIKPLSINMIRKSVIEQLKELYKDQDYSWMGFNPLLDLVNNPESGCNHEWKLYQGFTDMFEFCTKCEEKR